MIGSRTLMALLFMSMSYTHIDGGVKKVQTDKKLKHLTIYLHT